jgi:hypothetical protein
MTKQDQIRASTQDHLEIEDIFDDLVILKNSGAALVIQTTAVNFGLLSETEQDAIIYAYAGLLNSLSFPIQIVVRSKRMDVSSYLESLMKWEQKQPNEKIRIQIRKYREFITSTIRENNVLDKRFYVVLNMFPEELGLGATSPLAIAPQKRGLRFAKEYIVERAKNILLPKRDHMIRQLTRLGLKASQLTTQQLIELFYDIYNPSITETQRLKTKTSEYLSPIVSSASEIRQNTPEQTKTQKPDALAEEMSPARIFGTPNTQKTEETLINQTPLMAQTPTQTPQTQNMPPNNNLNEQNITPVMPPQQTTQNTQTQTQPTNPVILNLQKAIEEARRKNAALNEQKNTINIPWAPQDYNQKK